MALIDEINEATAKHVASLRSTQGGLGKTVDLTGLVAGDTLVYDAVNDKFVKGTASGTGDMNSNIFDANHNGIVDNAEAIDGGTF